MLEYMLYISRFSRLGLYL
uniref:Uncharacterized protein n=1 Tax=Arundo donax TaxID=35708 RepID=A0A0A8YIB9_ARUDO